MITSTRGKRKIDAIAGDGTKKHCCSHPFTHLPATLIAFNIFSQFLSLEEIVAFDTAVNNRMVRSHFLDVCRCMILPHTIKLSEKNFANWFRIRGFKSPVIELAHSVGKLNLQYLYTLGNVLTCLNVTGVELINDKALTKLSKNCHELRSLNLTYCSDITDVGLVEVAKGCHMLESLVLWGCYHVTDISLNHITLGCPKLVDLNLRCCKLLSDEGLQYLSSRLVHLQHLNLTYCRNITDDGLIGISKAFPNLRTLRLAYCLRITDNAIVALAEHFQCLEVLDLTGCEIGDNALAAIAEGAMKRSLRELHIVACRGVTDLGMHRLGSNCVALKSCSIAGCDLVTETGLASLQAHCKIVL